MFNVKLSFDTDRLEQDILEQLYAIFALKQTPELAENLKECTWYNGSAKENLLTGFLRN